MVVSWWSAVGGRRSAVRSQLSAIRKTSLAIRKISLIADRRPADRPTRRPPTR
jgi:hypothetical protein